MIEVDIFVNEISCCSSSSCCPSSSEALARALEMHLGGKVKVKRVNLFESGTFPQHVIKILRSFESDALPLVLVNGKPAYIGKLPELSEFVSLVKNQEVKKVTNILQEVTPTEMLWHKNTASYNLSSPQCCSTTYFCACASS